MIKALAKPFSFLLRYFPQFIAFFFMHMASPRLFLFLPRWSPTFFHTLGYFHATLSASPRPCNHCVLEQTPPSPFSLFRCSSSLFNFMTPASWFQLQVFIYSWLCLPSLSYDPLVVIGPWKWNWCMYSAREFGHFIISKGSSFSRPLIW